MLSGVTSSFPLSLIFIWMNSAKQTICKPNIHGNQSLLLLLDPLQNFEFPQEAPQPLHHKAVKFVYYQTGPQRQVRRSRNLQQHGRGRNCQELKEAGDGLIRHVKLDGGFHPTVNHTHCAISARVATLQHKQRPSTFKRSFLLSILHIVPSSRKPQ